MFLSSVKAKKILCFLFSGLDLMDYASLFMESSDESRDTARKAYAIKNMVTDMQKSFNLMEECPQPVIAAIHSACIGGGIDMITACDIRLCSSDAWFQIKVSDLLMLLLVLS